MNIHTPTPMRAPGEVSGNFALECAMDELAAALGIDPVELRLRNEPAQDEHRNLPFSSRLTLQCYKTAAERFGWSRRISHARIDAGRTMADWLGMATANYPMNYGTGFGSTLGSFRTGLPRCRVRPATWDQEPGRP